jgi:hypothetical protein
MTTHILDPTHLSISSVLLLGADTASFILVELTEREELRGHCVGVSGWPAIWAQKSFRSASESPVSVQVVVNVRSAAACEWMALSL